jgi:threonine synthase
VRYDLEAAAEAVSPCDGRGASRRLVEVPRDPPGAPQRDIVSLGETFTPLVSIPRSRSGSVRRWALVKDEGRLPTGSFKARGLGMAVAMAKELGLTRLAMPTNGNAGAAMAAYASRAGMETFIFCPADTPEVNVREIALQGAHVWRVDGLIDDCGRIVGEGKERWAGSTSPR